MCGPEEWPSCRGDPADRIRLTGPAANLHLSCPQLRKSLPLTLAEIKSKTSQTDQYAEQVFVVHLCPSPHLAGKHFQTSIETELWVGEGERSCAEPLRLLVWRKCRRLRPNNSAGPLRRFTDRNRAGFWRRSCASWEIWISPK